MFDRIVLESSSAKISIGQQPIRKKEKVIRRLCYMTISTYTLLCIYTE